MITRKNPAAAVTANGAAFNAFDTVEYAPSSQDFQESSPLAAARLEREFGLTPPTARTICGLAGIGGRHAE